MSRAGGARHVEFPERALVFIELPFVQEAEGAHAEGEDWGDGGGGGEEGGGAKDGAVAAEGGDEVDFGGEEGGCGGGGGV